MDNNLGMRIKTLRKKLNLTMEEFGTLVGNTTKGGVNKWEKNINKPTEKNLIRIAELANKTLDEFLSEESFELSISEANYLIEEVRYKEKKIGSIKNILDQYEKLSIDELKENVEALEGLEQITHGEYKVKLQNQLDLLEKEYLVDLKYLVELQNNLLNSQKVTEFLLKNSYSLDLILESNYTTIINGRVLTAEDKKRALEILKLVFN